MPTSEVPLRQSHKTILLWLLLILMFVSIYQLFTGPLEGRRRENRVRLVHAGGPEQPRRHQEGHDQGRALVGRIQRRQEVPHRRPGDGDGGAHRQARPRGKDRRRRSSTSSRRRTRTPCGRSLLGSWLPMLALVFIFFLFMRQLQSGGGKAMSFGKSQGQAARRAPEQGDLRRRCRRRGSQGRSRRDHRVLEGSEEVHQARRPHSQGRA